LWERSRYRQPTRQRDGGPATDTAEVGHRARTIRRRRGLSLEVAAGLAGISTSYLSRLERGERSIERRGLLDELAAALGCAVVDLTGQPYLPTDRDSADAAASLPAIIMVVYDSELDEPPDMPTRPVSELAHLAAEANSYLDAARFSLAVRQMGAVLAELHVHAAAGSTAVLAALPEACMVATATARHVGRPELAVQTARRGYDAARRLGDPALGGQLAVQLALGLSWLGARRRVGTVLGDAIADLEQLADPTATDTTPAEVAGVLHLTAAWHYAQQQGRAVEVEAHLPPAADLAEHTGERNTLHMHFGPAHVATWGLEVEVELGRGLAAVERISREVPHLLGVLGSANRQCVLHFDLARAYAQDGGDRDGEALRHLDVADRIAPQGVHNVPVARELLAALNRRARRRVWELDSLLNRFGMN